MYVPACKRASPQPLTLLCSQILASDQHGIFLQRDWLGIQLKEHHNDDQYVNADRIKFKHRHRQESNYILAQAPMDGTRLEFWYVQVVVSSLQPVFACKHALLTCAALLG